MRNPCLGGVQHLALISFLPNNLSPPIIPDFRLRRPALPHVEFIRKAGGGGEDSARVNAGEVSRLRGWVKQLRGREAMDRKVMDRFVGYRWLAGVVGSE